MKVGFVFHKDPLAAAAGIDILRLGALTEGLRRRGLDVEILAPVAGPSRTAAGVPVHPLARLGERGRYDILKTCYHFSMELIGGFAGPVVSRIVRVVDERFPERDEACRARLLECQERIRARSAVVVVNNGENAARWLALYGKPSSVELIPTGCPDRLPPKGPNPFARDERPLLFLGSIASPRMAALLNDLAAGLKNTARLHHIGQSKPHLYGPGEAWPLSPLIVRHGEMAEADLWDYVRYARAGLAIAPGPHRFDNDLAKIYTYLRGGLPVLAEEGIVNNDLVRATGWGEVFRYGDVDDAAARAASLLKREPGGGQEAVMAWMAREQGWERRVERYDALFRRLRAEAQRTGPC